MSPPAATRTCGAWNASTMSARPRPPGSSAQSRLQATGAAAMGPPTGGLLDRLPDAPHGAFLSDADFAVYVDAFSRSGFRGGLNWYRNFDFNWETTAYQVGAVITPPALMITAELDPVLRPAMADGMEAFVPDLEKHLIRDCGHWTQSEKPDELNRAMTGWLKRRFG
jgi:pimeloyl-ACP methyl ester carboxylesterase